MDDNWVIESISLIQSTTLPSKEEMEKLLPQPLPQGWEIVKCHALADGNYSITLGHMSPLPMETKEFYKTLAENPFIGAQKAAQLSNQMQEVAALTGIDMTPAGGKYDYYGNLCISGYPDGQTAQQFFENYKALPTQGLLSAPTPATSIDVSIGDLIQSFVPQDMVKEIESVFGKTKKDMKSFDVKVEKGEMLQEEALFVIGKNGEKVCQAVLINNFVIMGDILAYHVLPEGNTPAGHSQLCKDTRAKHKEMYNRKLKSLQSVTPQDMARLQCRCQYCMDHPDCTTLEKEGFIHKEKVEVLLLDIVARIKEGTGEHGKEAGGEIIRGENKIKHPKEKSPIECGDTMRTDKTTQIKLARATGNKIVIGEKTEIKINTPAHFELLNGSLTAVINGTGSDAPFEVHSSTAIARGCETVFSVWTDGQTATLTVIEGEVEFSDFKGNKVKVKENQSCICTREQGVQKPISLPINLKNQYKEI